MATSSSSLLPLVLCAALPLPTAPLAVVPTAGQIRSALQPEQPIADGGSGREQGNGWGPAIFAGETKGRTRTRLVEGWKFLRTSHEAMPYDCGSEEAFALDLTGRLCEGLEHLNYVTSALDCRRDCCGDAECNVWAWANETSRCYTGQVENPQGCKSAEGHIGEGRLHVDVQTGDLLRSTSSFVQETSPPECAEDYEDSEWKNVRVPHDFGVEEEFSRAGDRARGYLPYGKAWYRLRFSLPEAMQDRSVWFDFDGTYRDAHIWLNGVKLGEHLSGYTPYRLEIGVGSNYDQKNLHFGNGCGNVLAVLLDNSHPEGWWYDGGGIYRHVWLNSASTTHIAPFGVYVPSTVDLSTIKEPERRRVKAKADILINTAVRNQGPVASTVSLTSTMIDPSTAETIATSKYDKVITLKTGQSLEIQQQFNATSVVLWSLDLPKLYTMVSEIRNVKTGQLIDTVSTTFGVRTVRWDAKKGFFLNERPVKIKGSANHQDFAGVGTAVPDAMQTFRVLKTKEMGANAWRTAHNPPTNALLDATDRLGMLVMDENHMISAGHDLETLILRDRNHPSIILWSICNEGVLCEDFNGIHARTLRRTIKKLDPLGQRPVMAAMNFAFDERPRFTDHLDIVGINYNIDAYDRFHAGHPEKPLVASETSSDTSDRGIYFGDLKDKKYVSAFDGTYPVGGSSAEDAWCPIAQRPFIAGGFIWTGFDYRGEPTPYGWPNVKSHFGAIDLAGFEKDNFHYYRSVWKPDEPMLHMLPHWDWSFSTCSGACRVVTDNNGESRMVVNVWAYTTGDIVDLYLNGRAIGKRVVPVEKELFHEDGSHTSVKCRHVEWNVTYEPGTLQGIARLNTSLNEAFALKNLQTTEGAYRVQLKLDSTVPSGVDTEEDENKQHAVECVALIRAEVVDKNGVLIPRANHSITFSLDSGLVRIIGLGNGDPSSHESNRPQSPTQGTMSAFNGLARIILEMGTDSAANKETRENKENNNRVGVRVIAKADGLVEGELSLQLEQTAFC